jgi:eukaryotic-like serine/threonine-protein kinase
MSDDPIEPPLPASGNDPPHISSDPAEVGELDSQHVRTLTGPSDPLIGHASSGTDAADVTPPDEPETFVGRYRLVKVLGKGGFGIVWQAEQTEPIRREVALKIVKPGMDSAEFIARFEAERQLLALMDHPNIASVLDAGTTDNGQPYFVMELVKGVPITQYCDERKLDVRERLELFIPVCQAVQHAHQKSILHRDLKPSNILVTESDGEPIPKVIDFGIAKALGASQEQILEVTLALTQTGIAVGTPLYMSPEQADSRPDVDMRSDVYTLGVILHELVTGQTPLGREQLRRAALGEVLRLIREVETRRPSSRLLPVTEAVVQHATDRNSDPRKLGAIIRGDLDWILLRALEKERERRYESAAALAQDLQRYLNQEPVEAGPPSAGYRLQKFVARNRPAVMAACVVVVAIAAGLAISSWMFVREKAARQRAAAAERAQTQLRQQITLLRQGVDHFLQTEAKVREEQPGQKPSEVEEKTYRALAQRFGVDGGELREKLPEMARQLENASEATPLERANAAYVAKDFSDAERLAVLAADEAQKSLPTRHSDALQALELAGWSAEKSVRYSDALGHFREAEKLTDQSRAFAEWVRIEHALTWVLYDQGSYPEVERILRRVLAQCEQVLGPEHRDTLRARHYRARALHSAGQLQAAETEFRALVPLREKALGPRDPDTLRSRVDLAATLDAEGRHAEAEVEQRAVLALQEKVLGPEHPDTLRSRMNLAVALFAQGKYAEAELECRAVLAIQEKTLGPEHPDTLASRMNLASALFMQAKYAEAESEHRAVLAIQQKVLGMVHPDTLKSQMGLANALYARHKYAEAEAKYREVLWLQDKVLGPEHPDTLASGMNLAVALYAQGKYAEAESEHRTVLASREKVLGPEHPETISSRMGLANSLCAQHKYADAEAEYRAVLTLQGKVFGPEHPDTLMFDYNLARCLLALKQTEEAARFAQRALEGGRKTLGVDHPDTKRYEKFWQELQAKK